MKLSEQGLFELRVWLVENAKRSRDAQYVYDEIKNWDIDDINIYKRLALGVTYFGEQNKITDIEHENIINKMNFIKNGDKVRLKD
jgi:hypothetical protein